MPMNHKRQLVIKGPCTVTSFMRKDGLRVHRGVSHRRHVRTLEGPSPCLQSVVRVDRDLADFSEVLRELFNYQLDMIA